MKDLKSQNFKNGMKDGIPIALGYLAVSFAFGMMCVTKGVSVLGAIIISLTNVTSAGQFAGLDIIVSGGGLIELALTQLIINLRYSLMSFSLSQKFEKGTTNGQRCLVAFGVTDEIFGISAARPGKVSPYYNYGAIAVAVPGWVLGTALGGISGTLLPAMILSALSVALYGMFLAIIIPPCRESKPVLAVVASAMALSSIFYLTPGLKKISSGFVIIIITLLVSAVAAYFAPVSDKEEENDGNILNDADALSASNKSADTAETNSDSRKEDQ